MPKRRFPELACTRVRTRVVAWLAAAVSVAVLPAPAGAGGADWDRDGLSNRFELKRSHTSPRRADTDRDRLRDRFELRRSRTDPRARDTDRDGLADGLEWRRLKTSPRKRDTDGDGLPDGLEVLIGSDPRTKPNSSPSAPSGIPWPGPGSDLPKEPAPDGAAQTPSPPGSTPPPPPPPTELPPATCDAEVGTQAELVSAARSTANEGKTVCVRGGDYGAPRLAGIAHTDKVTLRAYPGEVPRLGYTVLSNVHGLRFEGLTWDRGGVDVWPGNSHDVDFVGNKFVGYAGLGFNVGPGNHHLLIDGNLFRYLDHVASNPDSGIGVRLAGNGSPGPIHHVEIRSNHFDHTEGGGVWLDRANDILVEGNEIEDVRSDVPGSHTDPGFISSGSRITIRSNWIQRSVHQFLVFPAASEITFENNSICCGDNYEVMAGGNQHLRFTNNTIWTSGFGAIWLRSETPGLVIRNNVLSSLETNNLSSLGPNADEDYNLIASGWRRGAHDISGPPQFMDPAGLDYRLRPGTLPFPAGTSLGPPPNWPQG